MRVVQKPVMLYVLEADRREMGALLYALEAHLRTIYPNGDVGESSLTGRMVAAVKEALA